MKRALLVVCLLLYCAPTIAAQDSLPLQLPGQVAFRAQDNLQFSQPGFNDSGWQRIDWWKIAFTGGPVWLRWHLTLPRRLTDSDKPAGLFLTAFASSEIWWDGYRLGSNGSVAASPGAERPGRSRAVFFVPRRLLRAGDHVVALRLSAQHASAWIATPVDSVQLATYGSPLTAAQAQYRLSLASVGALLLAAIILLAIRWRNRDRTALWLAAACLALLAQLATQISRAFLDYPYTWQGPRLTLIAVFAYLTGWMLLGFLLSRYGSRHRNAWLIGAGLLASPMLFPFGESDFHTFSILLVFLTVGLIASLLAARASRRDAWLSVAVIGLLLVTLLLQPERFLHGWVYPGFTLLLCIYFIDYTRAQARIRQALAQAQLTGARLELELLKKHLRPHFLMNTLTAAAEWLEKSPEQGSAMIEAVAEEFRLLDRIASRRLIPLNDELALTQSHMTVMGYRHDQTYELRACNMPGKAQVPPAVFHTLAENALTHNRYGSRRVTFSLAAETTDGGRIRFTFRCPPGDTSPQPSSEGTGTTYVKARLREAFGSDWTFNAGTTPEGGWATVIEVPER